MSPLSIFSGPYAFLARMGVFFLTLFIAIAFGFYEGWKWERPAVKVAQDKLTAFAAQIKTIGDESAKTAAAKDLAYQQSKEKADAEHTKDVAILAANWAAEYDRMRKQSANSAGRGQLRPVTVSTSLSCSTAAADRISAAVSESIAGARAALDECRNAAISFRDETARSLEQADRNTEALVCGVTWASKTLH